MSDKHQESKVGAINDKELPMTELLARMCTCTCTLLPLGFSIGLASVYARMWHEANSYNADDKFANASIANQYDLGASHGGGNAESNETNWSQVLAINSLLYLALSLFSIISCIGTYCEPLVLLGGFGHFLGFIA